MNERFYQLNSKEFVDQALSSIREQLIGLYGDETGNGNFTYLAQSAENYLSGRSEEELNTVARFDPEDPYAHLAGKVFAICYPDHLHDNELPTLQTLKKGLVHHFPGISGIHILPDRLMSHSDVWPQDFFAFLDPTGANELVDYLTEMGILDANRYLIRPVEKEAVRSWLEGRGLKTSPDVENGIATVLEDAYNSHFNDGGFSQKDRSTVDPRFGDRKDIQSITDSYAVMLDFVANHLDVDNPVLEAYKKGENDGSAFIIITPQEYKRLKGENTLSKTFRPRPFPLFTGLRKYPGREKEALDLLIDKMEKSFENAGLEAPDPRITRFLTIYFKVANDQGLTAEDKRIFDDFLTYLEEAGPSPESLFIPSGIQTQQFIFTGDAAAEVVSLVEALGLSGKYGEIFEQYEEEIFGGKFFVYTTFSESQSDLNPATAAGFRLLIDDLFHLLSSGSLAMLRLDAIKYLWKEIGRKNFDLDEGNVLLSIFRRLLRLVAPRVQPVDEVNSPDQVVYSMGKGGGFAYLFGQVNAIPTAFNEETLEPLRRLYQTMKKQCPPDLLLFVMLSTHDGRSVQGIGVHRSDGHVSIDQFYRLSRVIEAQGGRPKYRSVVTGQAPRDTFEKVCREAGLEGCRKELLSLFTQDGENLVLKDSIVDRDKFTAELGRICGREAEELTAIPAIDFLLLWMFEGKTAYELCCTSRSAFRRDAAVGGSLSPELEARRLGLAQLIVLTLGQSVPAVYGGDLLGLENDQQIFAVTGKPRDLNRHKIYLPDAGLDRLSDPFLSVYIPLLNTIIDIRSKDQAFYPGSGDFEYLDFNDSIFLHHPYAGDNHSLILGNILDRTREVSINLSGLAGFDAPLLDRVKDKGLSDTLSGRNYTPDSSMSLSLQLKPYACLWLKPV